MTERWVKVMEERPTELYISLMKALLQSACTYYNFNFWTTIRRHFCHNYLLFDYYSYEFLNKFLIFNNKIVFLFN